MPKIPFLTSNVPRDLRQYADRVREALDDLDKKLTAVQKQASDSSSILAASGLKVDPTTGLPQAPGIFGKYESPPAPTNLTADGALANIILTWDPAPYAGHAYTEIWAAPAKVGGGVPGLGDAVIVGQTPGSVFSHNIGGGATRWYWIRFVNIVNEKGPFNAVTGTKGETAQDPGYLIELLEGQITETELFKFLGDRIDLIDAGASVPGSVAARIAEVTSLPEWDPLKEYVIGEKATHEGSFYIATQPSRGFEPPNAAYWEKLGEYDSLTDALQANFDNVRSVSATLDTNYYTIASADQAIANAGTTLKSDIEDPLGNSVGASLANNYYTIASADQAIANAGTILKSDIEDPLGNSVGASLAAEAQTRADETGDLFGQYTVKIDLNGYVTGYGLASTVVNGTPTSDFIVRADSFSIGAPGGTTPAPSLPFIVRTTPTTINGENVPAGAYIKDAFIQNGTITTAKIGDAAIDTAKIANAAITDAKIDSLDAGKITTGQLSAARIDTGSIAADVAFLSNLTVGNAQIATAAITNAKIANAAVDTAKIANAAITDAKIDSLDAGKITTGLLSADRIDTADLTADVGFISDLTVDTLNIVNDAVTTPKIETGAVTTGGVSATGADISFTGLAGATVSAWAVVEETQGNPAVSAQIKLNGVDIANLQVPGNSKMTFFGQSTATAGTNTVSIDDTDFGVTKLRLIVLQTKV